jgi:hypothetical protein
MFGVPRTAASAGLVTGFALAFLGAALAAAAPAEAVEDPTRPDAHVTHGPSCRPGGLVVEVTAGTSPYAVRLATTRRPAGEDDATLLPGATIVLRTDDVDWGETIDGRLEFGAQDGSGVTYVDELEEYSFTRPTKEDCEAIASPPPPEPTPTSTPTPTGKGGRTPAPSSTSSTGRQAPTTSEGAGSSTSPGSPATHASGAGSAGRSAGRQVAPGERVTLRVPGFLPGERVTVQLHDSGDVLASATAGPDGTVDVEVRIPPRRGEGPATVDLVGGRSAIIADVDLQVAAQQSEVELGGAVSLLSLVAAAAALVTTVAALVSVAGRQRGRGSGGRTTRGA